MDSKKSTLHEHIVECPIYTLKQAKELSHVRNIATGITNYHDRTELVAMSITVL